MANVDNKHPAFVGTVLGGVVCGASAMLAWAAPTLRAALSTVRRPSPAADRLFEDAVVVVCTSALVAAALWLAVSVVGCTVDARRRKAPDIEAAAAVMLRPRIIPALVAAALGTVTTVAGVTAHAAREPELPEALDGVALPDRSYGGVRWHHVRVGDSLWSITADHLAPRTARSVVADRWPQLHELNRRRIGADPDLIHPGTTLRLPTWGPAPTRGATRCPIR